MKPKSVLRLLEIAAGVQQIATFTRHKTESDYMQDALLRSAVLWQLVRICEPVRSLARDDSQVARAINGYREIIGLRTLLIHEYAKVRHDLVWQYVQTDIPRLRDDVEALLGAPNG